MEHDLGVDLISIDWISEKCGNKEYAQNLYAALCNNCFAKEYKEWNCSWREAGDIVSKISKTGSYLDWYCSGIKCSDKPNFVEEGFITAEVNNDLLNLGWVVLPCEKLDPNF